MASVMGTGSGGPGAGGKKSGHTSGTRRTKSVGRLIETEVIPRLLIAHSNDRRERIPEDGLISAEDVALFAPLTVELEAHQLLAQVELFLRRGISVEQLLVHLLAPAARWLGDQWRSDHLDFVEVTMALWRLQEVLREVAMRSPVPLHSFEVRPQALFAPMPGDQHTFGTAVVDECFSRSGWDTELMIEPTRSGLINRVAGKRFDLLGLTVSNDCHIALLPSLISAVRSVSRNPNLCLLLGGRCLIERPQIAAEVGADGSAADALAAVQLAGRLVSSPLRAALV
jgi:MerR family transcriptional regulator, light-induced transcriptional regulator